MLTCFLNPCLYPDEVLYFILMFTIKVIRNFSAAHFLRNYRGKCENLHGHNWKVEAEVICSGLNRIGIGIDFKLLKAEIDKILKKLDHSLLNNIGPFKKENPSAENIAKYIFEELAEKLKKQAKIKQVTVWESDNASASYSEE